jgi:PAS domain S-box-containing protein
VPTFLNTPIMQLRSTVQIFDENRQPLPMSAYSRVRVLAEKKPASVNMLIVNKDTGAECTLIHFSAPVFDDEGDIRLVVNIFRDVSERKQREAELLRLAQQVSMQKARLDNVIRNVPGVIWDGVGAPGKQTFDYVSPYAERMSGYALAEWADASAFFQRVIPPADYPQVLAQTQQIFESGQEGTVQFRMFHADGRILHLEAHTSMIFDVDGRIIGACGVIMDITARKLAELELQATAEALRLSNKELEQFAYVASHDLQEPLRMVTSYLQLLEQNLRGKLDADGKEYIGFAVDGAVRMKKLINDLLAYSRVGRNQINPVEVNMNTVAEVVLHTLIEECGAKVIVDPLPVVRGDETQLTQLLQNLVGNAVKFCENDPIVSIGVQRSDQEYTFCVRDNGIGIDPQFFDRIFIIFQRLHGVGEYEGTGIGLAICKKIVQRHGGRIWVESEPGKGSSFYFTLPHTEGLTTGSAPGAADGKG